MEIYFATTNQGKLNEVNELFRSMGIEVKSLFHSFDNVEDVEETGTTFEENAMLKSKTYSETYQVTVLADDSGLEVYALDGEPGVYSARYAGENKDDQANLEKVIQQLEGKQGDERKGAFVCVMSLSQPGEETITTEGRIEGQLLEQPKGNQGFGYDPIFQPEGYEQSFGELGKEVKNEVSHRKQALMKMMEHIGN